MNKKISLLCFLLLFSTHLFAQEKDIEITPIPIQNINEVSAIGGIAQDSKGHLWLATYSNGLIKYDGKNMVSYRAEAYNDNSLATSELENIFIDHNGYIWLAAWLHGLDKFNPETGIFTHYRLDINNPKSIRSNKILDILEDEEGILWIGTEVGLDKFDPSTEEFTHIFSEDTDAEALGKEHIRKLYLDKEGIIWIGTGTPFNHVNSTLGGLFSYNRKTDEIIHYLHSEENNSLIDNRVSALFEDSRGVFWVGTAGDGLHTMDREKGTFTRHQYDPNNPQKLSRPTLNEIHAYGENHIRFINEDELGNIWIGTFESGINRYNPNTQTIRHYGQVEFNTESFWDCLKTQDGLLWISSWEPKSSEDVLFKINSTPKKIDFIDLGSIANSFLENDDGSLYIGTNLDGLVYLDTNSSVQRIFLDDLNEIASNIILDLRKDENGNLWVHTFNGLFIYDPNEKRVIKSFHHDPNNIYSISSDTVITSIQVNEYTVLIGTLNGFNVLDLESETFKQYFHDPGDTNSISQSRVTTIFKDSNDNIWVGNLNAKGNLFDLEKGNFKRYDTFGRLPYFLENGKGRLWLGARSGNMGLRLYDKEKDSFDSFLDNAGLLKSHVSIFGMTEDHDGLLWLNTSIGIVRLNPENGDSFLFGQSWGVNTNINRTSGNMTSSNGDILIGYGDGFLQFKPEKYKEENINSPSPFLDKFYIDNQELIVGQSAILQHPLSETTQITLDYTQNNFAIDYAYINYRTDFNEHQVLYKLENYEDAWRNNTGNNIASYSQVNPGNYVFRVRASNSSGIWQEKTINIVILPPWYQTWLAYILFILLAVVFIRGFAVYRSRKLKAENKILEEKVTERTAELKASQAQLIQSEKMASLGELTAGIAHEIQNPLNFVNNFSEVSEELLSELKEELDSGEIEEAKAISDDVIQNLQKINHHGNRASSIVKGMLEHSRKTSGEKELTDLNALADEYLRLSYHGLRAKDKDFNADFKMDFEESLPKIEVVSQDIGRVLLNLINNAFQATSEEALKRKLNSDQNEAKSGSYKPTVTVTTKSENDDVIITIKDNGPGIPDEIKDKIFQPFFTTKDTGKGTGLGLSLAYDIVKAHGGELKVETKENQETVFSIFLPL